MPDPLPTASRNAGSDGIVDLVDAGSGPGRCEVLTSGDAILVAFTLADPAFGAAGASVAGRADGASMPRSATATGAGTAAKCRVVDSDGTVRFSGTCGTTGTDAIIDNTSITVGQTCNLTALSFLVPAGGS